MWPGIFLNNEKHCIKKHAALSLPAMRAMILAAGLGTRLRPLTNTTPKALAPVAGRPLIEYALRFVRAQGIREVVINLHHLGDQIRARLGDGRDYGVRITYSVEERLLETGGGVKQAQTFLDGGTFLVVNSDAILDLDLAAVLAAHQRNRAVASLVLRPDPDAASYGLLEIDRSGRLRRLRGQPAGVDEPLSAYMFTGCQILEPRVFDFMPELRPFSLTRQTYVEMLRAGEPLYGFVHTGPWMVVDDAEGMAGQRGPFAQDGCACRISDLSWFRPMRAKFARQRWAAGASRTLASSHSRRGRAAGLAGNASGGRAVLRE